MGASSKYSCVRSSNAGETGVAQAAVPGVKGDEDFRRLRTGVKLASFENNKAWSSTDKTTRSGGSQ